MPTQIVIKLSYRNICLLKLLFSKKCTSLFTFLAQMLSSSAQQGHLHLKKKKKLETMSIAHLQQSSIFSSYFTSKYAQSQYISDGQLTLAI